MANHLSLAEERRRRMTRQLAIVQEYVDGRPIADIAQAYGVAQATVSRLATKFGVNRRRKVKDRFPDVARDYAAGMPIKEIVAKYLIDRKTIWVIARMHGLELRRARSEREQALAAGNEVAHA